MTELEAFNTIPWPKTHNTGYVPSEAKCWDMYNNGSKKQKNWAHQVLTSFYGITCECESCSLGREPRQNND